MEDAEAQKEEVEALTAIYGSGDDSPLRLSSATTATTTTGASENGPLVSGSFRLELSLEEEPVRIERSGPTPPLLLHHLPPLQLHFSLPPRYPSTASPILRLQANWLPSALRKRLEEEMTEAWEEWKGSPALFAIIQRLEDSTPTILREASPIRTEEVEGRSEAQLADWLLDEEAKGARRVFHASRQDCGVCWSDFPGSECVRFLPCAHVFCRDCAGAYLRLRIEEGMVEELRCLGCSESAAEPSLIRDLVPPEVFARYESLTLRNSLEGMEDVTTCPRLQCQGPVILEKEKESLQLSAVARCPSCSFTFCALCRRAYHGVEKCSFSQRDANKLAREYEAAVGEAKIALERRYGVERLRRLLEECQSEELIKEVAKACPNCRASIQKNDGCNKMSCARCGKFFCWLCMSLLPSKHPYDHFNNAKSPCFNLLFHGTPSTDLYYDDDDDEEDGNFLGL